MTSTRVIAYEPNGASLGPIPTPQDLQVGYPLNDLGALTLNYPPDAPRVDLLGKPVELAVEVSNDQGATWSEPPSSRFMYLRDGRDPIQTGDAWSVEAAAYLIRLQKALVGFLGLTEAGGREFTNANPGAIMAALWDEAVARGALVGMTRTWTAVNDSAGTPWPEGLTVSYDPGANLLSILQGFAEAGLVDFRTQGRSVDMFVADSATGMGADRTLGATPVTLRFGRDLTEAPFRRTWEALADTAMVKGDGEASLVATNPNAITPWGRQETYVTASGVTDAGTLQTIADASLTLTERERTEHTFGLDFSNGPHLPFRDYAPGEWVYAATSGGEPQRMRIRQITLTRDNNGQAGGNVVLNDRFLEADVLTARRIAKITNAATQAGTGGTPTGVGNDILQPAAPGQPNATSTAYVTETGTVQAQVSLDWPDVTTNRDGSPISDLAGYRVEWRPTSGIWRLLTETVDSGLTLSPFDPNQDLAFRVAAYDTVGNQSLWSPVAQIITASDTTPPGKPSTPTATSKGGLVEVQWDGENAAGNPMSEPDLARVEVHAMTTGAALPVPGSSLTLLGALAAAGRLTATDLPADDVRWIRLVAIDTSGNASEPSDAFQVTVSRITDGQVPVPPNGWAATLEPLGIMGLQATWPPVPNQDAVTYDVYLDEEPLGIHNPYPPETRLYGSTGATTMSFDRLPSGVPFDPTLEYHVLVVARDGDGPGGKTTDGPTSVSGVRQADGEAISPSYVYTGALEAGQVKSGSLEAALAILGELRTAAEGRNISLSSEDGLRAEDQNNNTLMHVPTDPALNLQMLLDVVALSITALGSVALRAPDNEVAQNAAVILRAGTAAPVTPPTVKAVWTERPHEAINLDDQMGNHIDADGVLWQTYRGWGYSGISKHNAATGAQIASPGDMPAGQAVHDIVRVGDYLYTVGTYDARYKNGNTWNPKVYLQRRTLAGALLAEQEVYVSTDFATYPVPVLGPYENGIAYTGTNGRVLLGLSQGANIQSNVMDTNTLTQVSSQNLAYNIGTGALGSIAYGIHDMGAEGSPQIVVSTRDRAAGDLILVFNPTGGARYYDREWPTAGGQFGGMSWDPVAEVWRHRSRSRGVYVTYDGNYWAGDLTRITQVVNTWYDSDPEGDGPVGAAFHETTHGPAATFYMPKRSRIQVTTPPIPTDANVDNHDDATAVRIYSRFPADFPNPVGDYLLQASPADGVTTVVLPVLATSNADTEHPPPPVAGNFPNGTPGIMRAEDPAYYFNGQGDAALKSLTVMGQSIVAEPVRPALQARKTSAQGFTANVTQVVIFDQLVAADGGMVLESGTITVPRAGWYQVNGNVTFAASVASQRRIVFLGKGTVPGALTTYVASNIVASAQDTANVSTPQVSALMHLEAGEVIGMAVNPATGWGCEISQTYMNHLSAFWVGP